MDYQAIIDLYYPEDTALRHILMIHSRAVMERALAICDRHRELNLDRNFIVEAAMLHDVGVFRCNAPGILCYGSEPYICHGRIGAELLRQAGFPRHARVCERHTGAGLTCAEIIKQNLPLLHEDFLPETLEEKLICYADKFYSKSSICRVKTMEQAERSLSKFGEEGVKRFRDWACIFE